MARATDRFHRRAWGTALATAGVGPPPGMRTAADPKNRTSRTTALLGPGWIRPLWVVSGAG